MLRTLMSKAELLRSALRLTSGNCERAYLAQTHFPEICVSFVPFDDDRLEALRQSRRRDCPIFPKIRVTLGVGLISLILDFPF